MNQLDRHQLESLMAHEKSHSVSIFMPVHLGGPDTRQNPIRLRTMLDEAECRLRGQRLSGPRAREHLATARELLGDTGIWRSEARGVAAYIANGRVRMYGVPISVPECVHVGPRFHTRHLLPMFVGDGRFYLLALSQNMARLFEASRWSIHEVKLPHGTPRSFAEASRFDDPERQLQWHTGAAPIGEAGLRAAVFHGHGVGTDELLEKRRLSEYCHMIAAGVERILAHEPSRPPLVLAAAEPTSSIYRQANHYARLHEKIVQGNPDDLTPHELRRRAWPLVEPKVGKALEEELGRYQEGRGAAYASCDLREVLTAASNGQIRTLFVSTDGHCWGRFDSAAREMETHPEPWPGDDDLLDLAASRVFLSGAGIFSLPPEQMPERALAAATFRYVPVV